MRHYMLARYHRRRKEAIHELGSHCAKCGTPFQLQFDHVVAKEKEFDLGTWHSVSNDKFQRELKKCQLLCRKCHALKTLEDKNQKPARGTHGTLSAYEYCGPPKCEKCRRAKCEWTRSWRKKNGLPGWKPRTVPSHGTNARYQRKCKCKECLLEHSKYQARYKIKRARYGLRRHSQVGQRREFIDRRY